MQGSSLVLASLVLLNACGGGGGAGTAAPAVDVPATPATPVAPAAPAAPVTATPLPLAHVATTGVPVGYTLVWADEFDVDGLPDPSKWDYDTDRNRAGWYNNEVQYYARDRPENARVAAGKLVITARRESLSTLADWGGQRYSSARLVTRGKANWTYGFIEIRAKLPCGRGTWPALWTLGTRGTWPDDGEIDILEQVGSNPTRIFGTLHTLQSGGVGTGGEAQVPDACSQFHNYQLMRKRRAAPSFLAPPRGAWRSQGWGRSHGLMTRS